MSYRDAICCKCIASYHINIRLHSVTLAYIVCQSFIDLSCCAMRLLCCMIGSSCRSLFNMRAGESRNATNLHLDAGVTVAPAADGIQSVSHDGQHGAEES